MSKNVKLIQPPVILCEPEPGGGYLLPPGRPIVDVGSFYTYINLNLERAHCGSEKIRDLFYLNSVEAL
jgi:hypothetical protein